MRFLALAISRVRLYGFVKYNDHEVWWLMKIELVHGERFINSNYSKVESMNLFTLIGRCLKIMRSDKCLRDGSHNKHTHKYTNKPPFLVMVNQSHQHKKKSKESFNSGL